MKKDLIQQMYSVKDFKIRGYQLIDQLAAHLDRTLNGKTPKAIHWNQPEKELQFWKDFLNNGNDADLFQEMIQRTIYIHHPNYMGHQVAPSAPITALTAMISGLLNNGMAVYEMGMSPSAIERVVTDWLCHKLGFDQESGGFLTSGGSLANLTALLTARKVHVPTDIWNNGLDQKLGIMVSEEAHYCIDRAAKIMGLGNDGIIKIPATKAYRMDTSLLGDMYGEATNKGVHVFAIVGSAPCTATGMFDDLMAIARFAEDKNLWFHVDAAHGGAAIFSPKYKWVLNGISEADSVVIDGHKMMMMPTLTTALLYKKRRHANSTFNQKAAYLLTESDMEDWFDSGKKTFECTKTMMALHWYTMLKVYGEPVFDANVTHLFTMGARFAKLIQAHPQFELAVEPMANIVCFRYVDARLPLKALNLLNANVRQKLLEDGRFYIVQTQLRGIHYLRVTIMNPFTTVDHFNALLKTILEHIGH